VALRVSGGFLISAWRLIRQACRRWIRDGVFEMSAAIAFYATFSTAPALAILLRLLGFFTADGTGAEIESQVAAWVGADEGRLIALAVTGAQDRMSLGGLRGALTFLVLFLGASAGFAQLLTAMNRVWRVKVRPGRGILGILRNRFWAFMMVGIGGAAFLISLMVSTGIQAYSVSLEGVVPGTGFIWHYIDLGFSFIILTILLALLYKFLPDARIAWSDVWVGAAVTAVFFVGGKYLISLYLATISIESVFGVLGSFLIILIWIYASTAILLLGAEFTHIYAEEHGHSVRPGRYTLKVE
jgi:membrane protein